MDTISSGDESDAEPVSTDMLENICEGSQYHPRINVLNKDNWNIKENYYQQKTWVKV